MSRHMGFLLTGFVVVAGIILLAWMFQRTLIYFPFGDVPTPSEVGLTQVEEVDFPTTDGLRLNGWFVRTASSSPRVYRGGVQRKCWQSGVPCSAGGFAPAAGGSGAPVRLPRVRRKRGHTHRGRAPSRRGSGPHLRSRPGGRGCVSADLSRRVSGCGNCDRTGSRASPGRLESSAPRLPLWSRWGRSTTRFSRFSSSSETGFQ